MMHWQHSSDARSRAAAADDDGQLSLLELQADMAAGKVTFTRGRTTKVHWPLGEVLSALESKHDVLFGGI